uniref:Uncharacterized protein n=1 Tax=Coccidioides posadasii RMSCC 3488 TaxID=454284 RepID=A0A0J6F1Q7_COCPO|nr:hypothetical protein CPAG_03144 [Coccidioides posadasii RMSCC 3488]
MADAASTIADLISKVAIRRAIGVADQSYDFSPRAQPVAANDHCFGDVSFSN